MKEKAISIILIIFSILAPTLILPNSIGKSYLPKIIVLVACGLALLIFILLNYKKLYLDKIDILLLIFGGLVTISTLLSSKIEISIIGEDNRYEGMLAFFTYILIFLSAKKFLKKEYMKKYANIMYFVVLLICILSISQYYITTINLPTLFSVNKYNGSSGTFGNSNFLGSFVSICLPITMAMYLISGKIKDLILANLAFASMLVCLARSSWVAFGVCFIITIIYILYKRKKEYFIRFALILITFVSVFGVLSNTGKELIISKNKKMVTEIKQATTTGVTETMGSSRIAIWKMTLKLISRNPIFGVGTDNLKNGLFKDEEIKYNELYNFIKRTHTVIDKAHNEYLQIAATIGIPALLIYLVFLGIIVLKNVKLSLKDNARFILILSIIGYLVQSFFNISTIGIAPLFWLILGLISNDEVVNEINENILK